MKKSNLIISLIIVIVIIAIIVFIMRYINVENKNKIENIKFNNSDVLIYTTSSIGFGTIEETSKISGEYILGDGSIHEYEILGDENGNSIDDQNISKELLENNETNEITNMEVNDLNDLKSNILNLENKYTSSSPKIMDGPSLDGFYAVRNNEKIKLYYYTYDKLEKNNTVESKNILNILEKYNIKPSI